MVAPAHPRVFRQGSLLRLASPLPVPLSLAAAAAAAMASKAAIIASTSKFRKWQGERIGEDAGMPSRINQLVKEIQAERVDSIKEKIYKNGKKVESYVDQLLRAASANEGIACTLASRTGTPLCKFSGFSHGLGDKDVLQIHEVVFSSVTKLPYAERLPPYTTWIFLDRNQRMADDQSVVGRRRIYYDQHGSETLICSDSEEEAAEPNEQKQVYSEAEDRLIWMAFEEYGHSDELLLKTVSQFVRGTALEIQERYKVLQQQYHEENTRSIKDPAGFEPVKGISLEKTLGASLDSFDNLFCRRCLVFDCRLHGCSQSIINPSERLPYVFEPDDGKPCSDQCHRHLKSIRKSPEGSVISTIYRRKSKTIQVISDAEEQATTEVTVIIDNQERTSAETKPISPSRPAKDDHQNLHQQDIGGMKNVVQKHLGSDVIPTGSSDYPSKKQKKLMSSENPEVDSSTTEIPLPESHKHKSELGGLHEGNKVKQGLIEIPHNSGGHGVIGDGAEVEGTSLSQVVQAKPNSSGWRPIEKELYLKGIEIFGRNSCLIARNMLSGLKTCIEVSSYMHNGGSWAPHRSITASNMIFDDNADAYMDYAELEMPARSRFIRKRGRTRKLKYSWKSAGHPSMWKRIADGKHRSCKQYLPCGCKTTCGKECPCLENGTCCEKYCGCSKSCKNRFRGCHCAKSQCRSRQCPCFAAGRECDPDVCRNCWVSCGDGSLGEPPRRGDGQCGNMRLLLRQQQRILLSKSDVAGWGAFLKKPVNKNDYLGEYTGELISHREADKRGKIYDRANSSFLFDLNDQYVLDAYRKGDKLKFANHSSNPNCYAKVMLVAGDHRVGIFAKEHIEASEELFYDYRYGPDQAPAWARKPEGSKRDDVANPQGRAKKHQSH